jgi:hypothetical protein
VMDIGFDSRKNVEKPILYLIPPGSVTGAGERDGFPMLRRATILVTRCIRVHAQGEQDETR